MSKYKKQDESDKKTCIICVLLLALLISSTVAVLGMMSAVDTDTDDDDDDDQWSTTSPTTTTTLQDTTTTTPDPDPVQYYRLTWTFQWDALLDPSAKCSLTITIRDPDTPMYIWDTLTLPEEVGDEPFTYHPMTVHLAEGQRVVIGISDSEGYEFIIGGLTVSTHYNSASATGISYSIGYDGAAAPIQVGTYFSEWEMV